ncbi:MAG: phospholipid carrier-dependent glycosyltransferase [Candidatus Peribacteraceae bacterium]|nr:phospholipid carrier-dependent glycosyltransferase [Candidatus Peribacteraceae bacterium]
MSQKTSSVRNVTAVTMGLYLLFVLLTSYFTYFYGYMNPQASFWDEPYHIAAAQKYLNGVFFMEQHPPLGKLLIALGEKITHSNAQNDMFITTDFAQGFEKYPDFSFTGFRLFPSLLGWLTAPILFLIFLFITKSHPLSALLSFLYIFDNAQIVHSRGAMVDSPLTFFGMLTILLFLHTQDRSKSGEGLSKLCVLSLFFGVSFALTLTTKVVGLIFILLVPATLYRLLPDWRRIVIFLLAFSAAFLVTYITIWQIHFSLASRIVPELNTEGYYHASDEYKAILANGDNGSLRSFPVMLRDSLAFVGYYNKGVPRLDMCKPDENGSPSFLWPIGAKTINYRWEQVNDTTFRYLYLVTNPVAWACGLIGVLLAFSLLFSSVFLGTTIRNRFLLAVFFTMYAGYMIVIGSLPRVMYLYHYFIPLLLSFILFVLAFDNILRIGRLAVTETGKLIAATVLSILIFAAFQFYRPLTYYQPISNDSVTFRSLIPLWDLRCVHCARENPLVVPTSGK